MKAVRLYGAGDLRVEEVPDPGPPGGDLVRIQVTAAGICGSDLHNFRTGQWISRAPSTPGHELTGVVEAVGPGATRLKPGDRVAADSRVWCGVCAACREGRRHLCESLGFVGEACDGGFAPVVLLPERLLHRVPDGLPPEIAAMAEPFAVALHAVNRLDPPPGEPVLVAGCGTIGGIAALILARRGAEPLLVADRNPARQAMVCRLTGALPADLSAAAIGVATGGRGLGHAVEATGSTAALATLVQTMRPGGRLALVGIYHGTMALDPTILVERELTLTGSHAFADELPEAIALLPAYAEALSAVIDGSVDLDGVPAAYARLIAGEAGGLKTIVRP
ncbi:zinc-dependent alcohol dehydrogenase [Chthonobacter albigriseus]|uniref:zinc-dependent alcohol dehydrogenase n=1 Tax=Chthonobacter albigriseus TaxID=1683161 RepID=UPI0015EEC492|nr:alcohol dehydrogenase catalytic domain-containing protein [Chthonobacter albigriseus]